MSAPTETLDDASTSALRLAAGVMGVGVAAMTAVVALLHQRASGRVPTPESVRLVNALTLAAMGLAALLIGASEAAWRYSIRSATREGGGARVRAAFLVRCVLREGAALSGLGVAALGAVSGALRVYPAYWANLAPAVLFWSFLCLHWPSAEKLKSEIADLDPGKPL